MSNTPVLPSGGGFQYQIDLLCPRRRVSRESLCEISYFEHMDALAYAEILPHYRSLSARCRIKNNVRDF
jgi:hypothetical protein